MTISIDCRMLEMSGIGRYVKELLPDICKAFSHITLLGNISSLSFYKADYNNITVIEMIAPIYSLKEQVELYKKIPSCDIFWSPHFNIPIFPIKAKHRVVTIHDVYHLAFFKDLGFAQKMYAKLFVNAALFLSDKVITVSRFSQTEILKYTSGKYADKISVIHNGVVETTYPQTKVSNTEKYILYVGNVKPHKNLIRALLAFKELVQTDVTFHTYKFKIVGKKDGFINGDSQINALCENDEILKKHVVFTGFVSDDELRRLYENSDLLFFPSYYEGFGFPPLEAMAWGCATCVSKAASLPEVCGDASIYFDPYDINDMKQKLKQVLKSAELRTYLIGKGYTQVKKFKWETAAIKHIELFNTVK